jgi:hypothetical protein
MIPAPRTLGGSNALLNTRHSLLCPFGLCIHRPCPTAISSSSRTHSDIERDGSEHLRPQQDKTALTSSYAATLLVSSVQPRWSPPLPFGVLLRPSDALLRPTPTASSNQHNVLELVAMMQEPSNDSQ